MAVSIDGLPTRETPVASAKWAVGLVGGSWELAEIAPHLAGDIRVRHEADGWELTATRFEETDQATVVRTLAGEMLALINGVARLRLDAPDPITLGNGRSARRPSRQRRGCAPVIVWCRLRRAERRGARPAT